MDNRQSIKGQADAVAGRTVTGDGYLVSAVEDKGLETDDRTGTGSRVELDSGQAPAKGFLLPAERCMPRVVRSPATAEDSLPL